MEESLHYLGVYMVILVCMFGCICLLLFILRSIKRFHQGIKELKLAPLTQALEALRKEHGTDYAYEFISEKSAIYIYRDLKKIGLVEDINAKVYDIGSVRGHRCSLVDPEVYTFGMGTFNQGAAGFGAAIGASIRRGRMNEQAKIDAQQKSGLFITVKDVDHPQWRIEMYDMNEQIKWNEILTQLFEGTLGK